MLFIFLQCFLSVQLRQKKSSEMGEIARVKDFNFMGEILRRKMTQQKPWRRQCQAVTELRSRPIVIKNQMVKQPSTYSSKTDTDIPLFETTEASFDMYLEDKPRVFKAIFPDKRRSQQLSEEEWRIQMLPIDFLFLTVHPVVDMRLRCKSKAQDYPPGVPSHISKVLELHITRWELQGLDDMVQPSHFSLGVHGILFSERHGGRSHLRGLLEMKISVVLPHLLALIPEEVLRTVSESVLRRLVENMKSKRVAYQKKWHSALRPIRRAFCFGLQPRSAMATCPPACEYIRSGGWASPAA
ncbi:hypothetical protein Nepgr_032057 [Nepenthes gracilis]|uniref:Uncharacterized protein n=1 Tax=Nepenthes gracilis TaxID=150966 RepID=A0AAD3TJE8_NEPGR|nr:hypothetical protein Nepgr_032057 [Nepenthes gracilis]